MPSYKYPILAKPSGITLEQHALDVMSEGIAILVHYPSAQHKYEEMVGRALGDRVSFICQHHDIGKEKPQWQVACQKDYEAFREWCESNNSNSYQDYVSAVGYVNVGVNIRKSGVRHEFHSIQAIKGDNFPIKSAIAAHHGKLNFANEEKWLSNGINGFVGQLRRMSNNLSESNGSDKLEKIAKTQYEYSALRGLLQFADHRASAKEEGEYVPTLTPFSYKFPHPQKRPVQQIIDRCWERDLLLLRAPTGAGKTDASLLWASLQIERKRADRLVIAMPTRFTSNALAINVSETLSDTGLYHSSAWYSKYQADVKEGGIDKRYAEKEHELARLLETPVTVCTIDHLLMALTLTREDHHLITFNLANSCVVIDEADFYDDFTQANILVLLELLKYWKVPVLLMSASLPESSLDGYRRIGYTNVQIEEDTSDGYRERFMIKRFQQYSSLKDIEEILTDMMNRGTGIIYANTVDRAFELLEWFGEHEFYDTIIYHSRFTEPDKKNKEEQLIKALGKEAWKEGKQHGIAILTQIGEMSINISADMMISDLCPIDRLTQRAGRLCRFDKGKVGELNIIVPMSRNSLYPAPYGTYNQKTAEWTPCVSLIRTQGLLECKGYSSNDLVDLLNKVYDETMKFSSRAKENANNLKDYFMYNWLIGSKELVSKDADAVNFWSSRNIPPQESVYVTDEEQLYFNSYSSFYEWKQSNSIEIPVYLIKQGVEKFSSIRKMENVQIREDDKITQITLYVVQSGCYDKAQGLNIKKRHNNFL